MKKQFIRLFLLIFPFITSGQSIFEKFQNNKNVISISITPKMFQMLGSMAISSNDPESIYLKEIINEIKSFNALITSSYEIINQMTKWVDSTSKKEDIDKIFSISEEKIEMNIYAKDGQEAGGLKTILIFSKGLPIKQINSENNSEKIEAFLLLVEGNISIENISKLIGKMNLPGSDQLKKAGI
jgi:hypothetical protein